MTKLLMSIAKHDKPEVALGLVVSAAKNKSGRPLIARPAVPSAYFCPICQGWIAGEPRLVDDMDAVDVYGNAIVCIRCHQVISDA